jgi:hypothetical protein
MQNIKNKVAHGPVSGAASGSPPRLGGWVTKRVGKGKVSRWAYCLAHIILLGEYYP